MKLRDVVNVIGRGTVLVCDIEDEIISLNDYAVIGSEEYLIRGIERLTWNSKTVGLIISWQDDIERIKGKTINIRNVDSKG